MNGDDRSYRSISHGAAGTDRRSAPDTRIEGHVIECDGERAIIAARSVQGNVTGSDDDWAVGRLISIRVGENRLVGMVFKTTIADTGWHTDRDNTLHIHVEFLGEVRPQDNGTLSFSSGLSRYPYLGAIAHRIRAADLAAVYAQGTRKTVPVGALSQDMSISAHISVDDLLSRHFAIVGTTGVGKSSAVTLLMRKIVEARPDVRILILDPHNEFASAFPDISIAIDHNTLDLPFWMFRLDEFAEVVFRGRTPDPAEMDALRDLVQAAREQYRNGEPANGMGSLRRRAIDHYAVSADTPVPYRLADLFAIIDERSGQLNAKSDRPYLRTLRNRLVSISNDPRFRFMFANASLADTMSQTIARIFRIPDEGRPICAFQLAGLPSEVVNSVASVLCRLAFDIAVSSDGRLQTLVVCEEAHRYIPADINAGFWPTRQAIARIAKEGRKYGAYLGVISQRPGELDPTILSQCSTIFAMRLGNESDQTIIKGALRGAARSMAGFLSSISNREAIAFGEALATPMRMTFASLEPNQLPGAQEDVTMKPDAFYERRVSLESVVDRLRNFNNASATAPTAGDDLWGSPALSRNSTAAPDPALAARSNTERDRADGNELIRAFRPDERR